MNTRLIHFHLSYDLAHAFLAQGDQTGSAIVVTHPKRGRNDKNGQLIYDHTGIGTAKDNINTSIGMKKMPVLVLARLAEIKLPVRASNL